MGVSEQPPKPPMNPTCPDCGTPIASGALAGLCPACLLKSGAAGDSVTQGRRTPFEPPAVADLTGLFPALEIIELIGKGGMGAVYKARQKQLDRPVALKILPPSIGEDAAFAERFAREARALAKLNHPGIVTLYEFGHVAQPTGPLFYFLMEFVDGMNLKQLLDGGRVSPREALAIVPQICDALQFAHDQGIVHRDIKPENLLIDRRGVVKVADFGLAKLVGNDGRAGSPLPAGDSRTDPGAQGIARPTDDLTDTGKVMGTPRYMAPEQSERPSEVDHRADIYALGVVFYQMLTGELPAKELRPPSTKVQIDVRLDEIVLRALERNPAQRYAAVSEMKTEMETLSAMAPNNPKQPRPTPEPKGGEQAVRPISTSPSLSLVTVWWFIAFPFVAFAADSIRWPNARLIAAGFMPALPVFLAIFSNRIAFGSMPEVRRRRWFLVFAWLGWAFALPAIGFAVFFFNALLSERGGWNPAFPEILVVPVVFLGAVLLPAAAAVLWRASGNTRRASWPMALASSAAAVAIVVVGGGGMALLDSLYLAQAKRALNATKAAIQARSTASNLPPAPANPNPVPDFQIRRVLTASGGGGPSDPVFWAATSATVMVERAVLLDGSQVAGAFWEDFSRKSKDGRLRVQFTPEGTRRYKEMTRTNVNNLLAVFVSGKPTSMGTILAESPHGRASISGDKADPEWESLLEALNSRAPAFPGLRFGTTNTLVVPAQSDIPQSLTGFLSTNATPKGLLSGGAGTNGKVVSGLPTYGLSLQRVGVDTWDLLSPKMARQHWEFQDTSAQSGGYLVGNNLAGTYLFKTAADVFGVIQVMGATPDGSGVSIRYKLVESAPAKTIVLTRATNNLVGTTTNTRTVGVWSDSLLLPGESFEVSSERTGVGRQTDNAYFSVNNTAGEVRTKTTFSWFFLEKDGFGAAEADEATSQIRDRMSQRPLVFISGSPMELFRVTNRNGSVIAGSVKFARTEPAPVSPGQKVETTVRLKPVMGALLFIDAAVPPGYRLQAADNSVSLDGGSAHTSMPGMADSSVSWFPPALRFGPDSRKTLFAQIEQLAAQGPITVVAGQPSEIFSITNKSGEIYKGFLELVGPKDGTTNP